MQNYDLIVKLRFSIGHVQGNVWEATYQRGLRKAGIRENAIKYTKLWKKKISQTKDQNGNVETTTRIHWLTKNRSLQKKKQQKSRVFRSSKTKIHRETHHNTREYRLKCVIKQLCMIDVFGGTETLTSPSCFSLISSSCHACDRD